MGLPPAEMNVRKVVCLAGDLKNTEKSNYFLKSNY